MVVVGKGKRLRGNAAGIVDCRCRIVRSNTKAIDKLEVYTWNKECQLFSVRVQGMPPESNVLKGTRKTRFETAVVDYESATCCEHQRETESTTNILSRA
jgi:hypothetical protein